MTTENTLEIPEALRLELLTMRQSPEEFRVSHMTNCKFGCGKGVVSVLTHYKVKEAGAWCPTHGWIFFESPQLPPKEK